MDAITEPGVEAVVVLKAAQVGFSEGLRNVLGYWITTDPGPCLLVMPDQKSAEELIAERVRPLLEFTPAVAKHVTSRAWDVKKASIKLDSMSIYVAWAGSSQAMKSRPIRYLLLEEPDEYVAVSGGGGDPISKAMKRITTYSAKGRARVIMGGTPTTRANNMWKAWEGCSERRHYWCPCPSCGTYQRLLWKQVKWPEKLEGENQTHHSARVLREKSAWYECSNEACKARITDEIKTVMLGKGLWANEDQVVTPDGRIVGPASHGTRRIGFCLPATYSPWVSFARLASEFIAAQGDIEALCDFINQRLAEAFEQQVEAPKVDEFTAKRAQAIELATKPSIVPAWAGALFMTVDVQMAGMWCLIRAWGWRYRSRLIWYGFVHSFDEVYDLAVHRLWEIEGGGQARVQMCLIDSGGGTAKDHRESRTQEVYRFCEKAPGFLIPIKGESSDQIRTVRASANAKDANGRPVPLYTLHTQRLKDELMRLVRVPAGGEGEWELNSEVDAEYLRQMTAEHKIRKPNGQLVWEQKGHADNHLWDDEVYQVAAADPDLGAVGRIKSPEQIAQDQETLRQRQASAQQNVERPTFMPERPSNWMKK